MKKLTTPLSNFIKKRKREREREREGQSYFFKQTGGENNSVEINLFAGQLKTSAITALFFNIQARIFVACFPFKRHETR